MATRRKLSLHAKMAIVIAVLLGAMIIFSGMPETAQFYTPVKMKIPVKEIQIPTPTSKPITVCKSGMCDSTTISEGITKASEGGIIIIMDKEVYAEDIAINVAKLTLDCNGASIMSSGEMIILAEGVAIKNCIISGTTVHIANANSANIVGNNITALLFMQTGIIVEGNYNAIENNKISSFNGIIAYGRENVIRSNAIVASKQQGAGAAAVYSKGGKITVINNTITGGLYGILLENANDSEIASNTVLGSQSSSIDLKGTSRAIIKNNAIEPDNSRFGIHIDKAMGIIISQNQINNVAEAEIYLTSTSLSEISKNKLLSYSQYGISVIYSNYNDVFENQIEKKSVISIDLTDSSNNKLSGNKVKSSLMGLELSGSSSNNSIQNNNITYNSYGILFGVQGASGRRNQLVNNFVCSNKGEDIGCLKDTFYGSNNTADAVSDSCTGLSQTLPCTKDITKPTVSVSVSPTTLRVGQTATITVGASDNHYISEIKIYIKGVLEKTCAIKAKSGSCIYQRTFTAKGNYTINATASDPSNNFGSATKNITVSSVDGGGGGGCLKPPCQVTQ